MHLLFPSQISAIGLFVNVRVEMITFTTKALEVEPLRGVLAEGLLRDYINSDQFVVTCTPIASPSANKNNSTMSEKSRRCCRENMG